jgi:MFS family permease
MRKTSAFAVLCAIGGLAIFSSTIAKNPVLPILAQDIGATKAVIGLIAAASTVTGILTSLPAGLLSDRRGRRPVLIGSGLVFFTAPLLYFLIRVPWQLAAVRVYHGLATAVFGPVAMAYVADLAPTRRGERLGYFSSTTLAGRALAPVVGGTILVVTAWQWVYVVCAAAALLALAGMLLLPDTQAPARTAPAQAQPRAPLRAVVSDRNIVITSVAEAAQFMAFGALEAFLPLYALSVGINEAAVGLLFGMQIAVRTLARPLMGILSDRRGRKGPIVVGLTLTGVCMALFAQTCSWLVLLAVSVVFGLAFAITSAATEAFVADLAPKAGRGTALGFMSTIMDVGQSGGPILLGAMLVGWSYQVGFAVVGGLVLLAMAAFAVVVRPGVAVVAAVE